MKTTIRYRLSAAGQKAAILAGQSGAEYQEIAITREDPAFTRFVALASISSDGSMDLDARFKFTFDAPQAAEQIIAKAESVYAENLAKEAAEKEAVAAAARKVLAEKVTEAKNGYAELRDEGCVVSIRYDILSPAWPYMAPESVKESQEAKEWLEELAKTNMAAKATAESEAATNLAGDIAEKKAKADAAAKAKHDLRVALGVAQDTVVLLVEDGALSRVPADCWESHKRGKNWLAAIEVSPSSPGGLKRDFQPKAKGDQYYLISGLSDMTPVEFGADYYSGSGKKNSKRWYGVWLCVKDHPDGRKFAVLVETVTGKTACKLADLKKNLAAQPA